MQGAELDVVGTLIVQIGFPERANASNEAHRRSAPHVADRLRVDEFDMSNTVDDGSQYDFAPNAVPPEAVDHIDLDARSDILQFQLFELITHGTSNRRVGWMVLLDMIFTKKSTYSTLVQMRKFQVITLFPEMFTGVFGSSMMWKAQKDGYVELSTIDLRQFGIGPRKTVDDTPYGGGDGMLLKPEPLFAAVEHAKANDPDAKVVLMTARGQRWKQATAQAYANSDESYIFVCGRYEGYDERITTLVDYQVSVGDYVLTGGELPAMTVIDSIVRLIPGVLGGDASAEIESFSDGETLEFPQYTKPAEFRGLTVPDVLLSGNHAAIAKWRQENSQKAN